METFAGKIRAACQALAATQDAFTVKDVAGQAMIQTRRDEKRMHNALRDFIKQGEAVRVDRGVYSWTGNKQTQPAQKQAVMWRIVRARRVVSRDDLVELAGVSKDYAKEYLGLLVRRGLARRLADYRVQLINDPGPTVPVNERKAEKLRNLRKKLKAAATANRAAGTAINEAITAIDKEMKE